MADAKFPTPGSVKTLRRYWKDRSAFPDASALQTELLGESDKASIILFTALLDDALTYLIARCSIITLTEDNYDQMFRFEGPLGSFSARMEIAYTFGIIDEVTRSRLDIIREMRNACAHAKRDISFATKELVNVVKRIFKPVGVVELEAQASRLQVRNAFITECAFIYQILIIGSRENGIAQARAMLQASLAAQPPSPDKPTQP